MSTGRRSRPSPAAPDEEADDRAGQKELHAGRDPAVDVPLAVKELPPTRPQPGHDMFEVRRGSRRAAEHGRIEQAATRSEQRKRGEAAADLEAQVVDVVVRDTVARDVNERSEQQSKRAGARERAGRGAGRDVKRDDHERDDRVCSGHELRRLVQTALLAFPHGRAD